MQLKESKSLAGSPGHMKVKVTLLSEGFVHLEQIFIVNPLPVARFEDALPYVVRCFTAALLNQRLHICHF